MKKIVKLAIISLLLSILAAISAAATEVALYVEFEDGSSHSECLHVDGIQDGYNLLEASSLNLEWSDTTPAGRELCSINGQGGTLDNGSCVNSSWSAYFSETQWKQLPVSFDAGISCWDREFDPGTGHYCGINGDMIGLGLGAEPADMPSFGDICRFTIVDLDVKVDGDTDKDLKYLDKIGDDAEPGSSIKLKIKLENFDHDNSDIDMEDVSVVATIYDIDEDDDDDVEEEYDDFDVNAGKTKSINIDMDVPVLVDEGEYELDIEVTADGSDNKEYKFIWTIILEVDKKPHDLRFRQASISNSIVSCSDNVALNILLANLGSDEEDDVKLEVSSPGLDFFYLVDGLELSDDPFDDDSNYHDTVIIDVPRDTEIGRYPVTVKAYYDRKLGAEENLEIEKQECAAFEPEVPEEDASSVLVVGTPVAQQPLATAAVVRARAVEQAEGISETLYISLLLIAIIVTLILILVLLVALVR